MDRAQVMLLQVAMGLYFIAFLVYLIRFGTRSERVGAVAGVVAWLGLAAHSSMLVVRGVT